MFLGCVAGDLRKKWPRLEYEILAADEVVISVRAARVDWVEDADAEASRGELHAAEARIAEFRKECATDQARLLI